MGPQPAAPWFVTLSGVRKPSYMRHIATEWKCAVYVQDVIRDLTKSVGSEFIEYNGVIGGELMPDTILCSGDTLHIELHAYIARICSHEV